MENCAEIYVWKDTDVIGLIKTRTALNYLFTGKRVSSSVWEIVAANLRCGASAYQCKRKWENLQKKYKTIMVPPTGRGLEERPHGAHDWPFFEHMEKYMSSRHTVNPLLVLESATYEKSTSPKKAKCTNVKDQLTSHPSSQTASNPLEDLDDMNDISLLNLSCTSALLPPAEFRNNLHDNPATPEKHPEPCCSTDCTTFTPLPGCSPTLSESLAESSTSSSSSGWSNVSAQEGQTKKTSQHPRKRKRTSSSENDSLAELVNLIKEDMENQKREREEARALEADLLDVLRNFLSKN